MKKVFLLLSIILTSYFEASAQVLPPPPSISSQPASPVSYCRNIQATIPFSASGFFLNYQWTIYDQIDGVYISLTANSTYSNVNTNTLRINTGFLTPGTYYYRCYVSNAGGSVSTIPVQFTVLTSTASNAPTTTGASRCGTGSVTLGAAGGVAGQYRWYTAASGGTAITGQTSSTYNTPTLTGTTNYYVAINNGTCESDRTKVTATINIPPTAPTTTDASICGSGTVTLGAAGGTAGQYRWYTVSTGGTAIAGESNAVYTTPALSVTTNFYVAIYNGTCESNRTLVVATINTLPLAPTTTGSSLCGSGAMTLSAGGGSAGQYRWYTVPTGGTAVAGQTNSAYTTPVITTTTTYYVSINNGTCESTRTSVTATINTIPSAPGTTGNSACGSAAVTLNASGGSAGQYRWYTIPTGGTAIGGQTNSSYTTPVITTTTTYYVSINNGTCESTRVAVVATINEIPASPNVTSTSSCVPSQLTLTASGASDGNYLWYDLPTGGSAIAGEVNSTFTTPTLTSTTDFFVAVYNGFCKSPRVKVTATIGGSACTNHPPAIVASNQSTTIEGMVTINLLDLISDADDNLDLNSLKITSNPISGAEAQIINGILTINYSGLDFSGEDKISIEVCDLLGSCSQQEFTIEVTGDLQVYNGISPNNDPYNNKWIIPNISSLPETKSNHVSIFNRWGDVVFEIDNYDNEERAFIGISNKGKELGAGVYFYKIEFRSGRKTIAGYLTVKK